MSHPSWNDSYASGEPLPWDTGTPDAMLVEMIEADVIAPGRALEIGCGTGTNAIYLAQHGFDVLGVDISPAAVEIARVKAHGACRFETVDFLNDAPPDGPFQFVFDRGCFHTFDEDPANRAHACDPGSRDRDDHVQPRNHDDPRHRGEAAGGE